MEEITDGFQSHYFLDHPRRLTLSLGNDYTVSAMFNCICFIFLVDIFFCIPDEKIEVNPRLWSGLEILF